MSFDIGELIRVLAENCPNEAVGLFIATYGVFIVAFVLIVIVLVRAVKRTGFIKDLSDKEIKELKEAIGIITDSAAKNALDNANTTSEIKEEIRANNDTLLQLVIAFGIANGMNYTDIKNTIDRAKSVYTVSNEQYKILEQEASARVEESIKKQEQEELEAKALAEEHKRELASVKIGA